MRACPCLALALATSLALAAAPAAATDARVRSLGGLADAFEDDSNALRWPGSLIDYAGQAALGLSEVEDGGTSTFGSANLSLGAAGRWGVVSLGFADRLSEGEPGGFFAAGYAHRFGPLNAALTFRGTTYGTAANPAGEAQFTGDARYLHTWGFGARADLGEGVYVDGAAETVRSELEYDDNALDLSLHELSSDSHAWRLRGFARVSEKVVVVPHVSYAHDVRPTVSDALGGPADLSGWNVLAGLGVNTLLDPDNLLVLSLDYLSLRRDWSARYPEHTAFDTGWRDIWQFVVRVGFESRVQPWLTLRAGAVYRRLTDEWYLSETLTEGLTDYDYRWNVRVAVPVAVGLGLHFGAFDGDLVVHDGGLLATEELPAGLGEIDTGVVTAATLRYTF
jgi:hypothetical protein